MLLTLTDEHVDGCPCGRPVERVEPLELPLDGDDVAGRCVIDAVPGDHFGLDTHPLHRPDVIALDHPTT